MATIIKTNEKNSDIVSHFESIGIHPKIVGDGFIQFERDECHNVLRMHEWDILDHIRNTLTEIVGESFYVSSSWKTDDHWYWEILKK